MVSEGIFPEKETAARQMKTALRFFPPAGLIPQANHLYFIEKSLPSSPFRCGTVGDAPILSEDGQPFLNGKNPQIFSDIPVI
jgi:hypothetical protein